MALGKGHANIDRFVEASRAYIEAQGTLVRGCECKICHGSAYQDAGRILRCRTRNCPGNTENPDPKLFQRVSQFDRRRRN